MNFSDEEAWQAYLDTNPEDYFAREVFADWLDDRCDPRAAGYRALGRLKLKFPVEDGHGDWTIFNEAMYEHERGYLPGPWFKLLEGGFCHHGGKPIRYEDHWRDYPSLREGTDAMALAWGRLPPERQAEILARVGVVEVG